MNYLSIYTQSCLFLISCFILTIPSNASNDIYTEFDAFFHYNFQLIIDIKRYYNLKSIYIISKNIENSFGNTNLHLLRHFSERNVLAQTVQFSELNIRYNNTFKYFSRFLFAVFIQNEEDLNKFQEFTKIHNLTFHDWLLIFCGTSTQALINRCEKPTNDILYLNFDYQVLVKCFNNSIIREWYSTKSREEIKVFDLMQWDIKSGLKLLTKKDFYQRRRDFGYAELNIAPVKDLDDVPVMTKEKEIINIDVFQKIILEVLHCMNFNINLLQPSPTVGKFNKILNQWRGLLNRIFTGKVELGFGEFLIGINRSAFFDFSTPMYGARNVIYFRDPENCSVVWNAYLKGFTDNVWIAFLILLIVTSTILTWIKIKINGKNEFASNFLDVWAIYCQQGINYAATPSSWKIAIIIFILSQIVVFALYSAFLASYLATLSCSLPFNSLSEFIDDGSYKFVTVLDSGAQVHINTTDDPIMIRLRKLMLPRKYSPLNSAAAFDKVCRNRNKIAFFTSDIKIKKVKTPKYCKLAGIYGQTRRYLAIPLPKDSPLKYFFNYHIHKFRENGIMKRLFNEYFKKKDDFVPLLAYNTVGIREITPAILIVIFGIFISMIILLLEHIVYYKTEKYSEMTSMISIESKRY